MKDKYNNILGIASFTLFGLCMIYTIISRIEHNKYNIHTEIRIIKYGNIEVKRDTIDVITIKK